MNNSKNKAVKDNLQTQCSINREFSDGSCFSLQELHEIANDYNNKYNDKIQLFNTKKEMVQELESKLKSNCSDQTCWATLKFVKNNEDLQLAFKPKGPAGQYDWLSTTEINECMERFMKIYPNYLFVGAVPIDIEDLDQFGVGSLNYDKLQKKNFTNIGIIYNLDEHYKSGSHWVSFFMDLKNKRIYYSDSAGKPPEQRVKKLVKKLAEKFYFQDTGKKISLPIDSYMNEQGPNILEQKYDIKFNKTQHQYGGSECGVYSINLQARLLRGDQFEDINNSRIPDKVMNVCRKHYFTGYNYIKNQDKNIC